MNDETLLDEIHLDGEALTPAQVLAIAHGQPGAPRVVLGDAARERVERAARAVADLVERGEIAYGITTGFGAFKDRVIPTDQVERLQRNILVSHAVGVGDPFDTPTVRAILLIRANTLARGFSGVRVQTVERLLDFLNHGVHPLLPEKGSLGASGDLAPLAHMALPLIGLGEAEWNGKLYTGGEALRRAGLSPLTLTAKEGLALTNGTSVMAALGVLAIDEAERLCRLADAAGAACVEALHGTPQAFDERIHAVRGFSGQIRSAAALRRLLSGSTFTRPHDPKNIQDAYTLRCIPQVHGAVRDALEYVRGVFSTELNAVTDNPLLFLSEDGAVEVLSGGNFHGEPLAIAFDTLAIAVSELGNISERRTMRLMDSASNGGVLPAFLTREEGAGINSGFMILQYTAAALASENKVLAHPACVDNIPTSANVEDHVSMGVTAGLKCRQVLRNVRQVLAIEILSAVQGIDLRRERLPEGARLGDGTQAVYDCIRAQIPFFPEDAVFYEAMRCVTGDDMQHALAEAIGRIS